MAKLNGYGIISGWHLFELADKAGQKHLHDVYSDVKYWLTADAEVKFMRQSSADTKFVIQVESCLTTREYAFLVIHITDPNGNPIMRVSLHYVGKDHLSVKASK